MSIRAVCPSCQLACRVDPRHAGGLVRCPGCQIPFTVPQPVGVGRMHLSAATSPGKVRKRNEDSTLLTHLCWSAYGEPHELALAVVVDGMGGHDAGDRASVVALAAIAQTVLPRLAGVVAGVEAPGGDALAELLDLALWEASRMIRHVAGQEPGCAGMGATAVAALVHGDEAAICHVGDCRAYLLRGGRLEQRTEDQTLVRRMLQLGTISEREARSHPAASRVSQALGQQYDLEPSRQVLTLQAGDVLLLACDGLHGQVSDDVIRERLAGDDAPSRLVQLADEAGGQDNCTAAVIARR